jgi:hypothetical protein
MMAIFEKLGYSYCGEVHLRGSARKAYEKYYPKRIRINLSSQARLLFQHNRTAKDCNTFEKHEKNNLFVLFFYSSSNVVL